MPIFAAIRELAVRLGRLQPASSQDLAWAMPGCPRVAGGPAPQGR